MIDKNKPPKPEEGFTMLEVLVTSLILVGFLLGSLQAITLATLLRVQAQRKTEALSWINQDKTQIEYEAFSRPVSDPPPTGQPDFCNLTVLRDQLISGNNTLTPPLLSYSGTPDDSPSNTTTANSNETVITLLNKDTYSAYRIYTLIPNATNPTTLQITWHIWDEGNTVVDNDTGGNPNLGGTGGDADDRSIVVLTTEVVPNIVNCN